MEPLNLATDWLGRFYVVYTVAILLGVGFLFAAFAGGDAQTGKTNKPTRRFQQTTIFTGVLLSAALIYITYKYKTLRQFYGVVMLLTQMYFHL